MSQRPILGITMGDPAGTGAELTVKALTDPSVYGRCRPVVIGDAACMEAAVKITGRDRQVRIRPVKSVAEAKFEYGTIDVYDLGLVSMEKHLYGKVSSMCGEAAFQYVKKVIGLAMDHEVEATVTNAINKEAINMAKHYYSGHTEIYADATRTSQYAMMLAWEDMRVVHVSTHLSLRQACDKVKKGRVLEVIRMADRACRQMGIRQPKIGVAGLNPHCGENGLFGTEEIEEIQPAIDQAISEGILIPDRKPAPPDTIFSKALGGWYDIVVAMYHDQGHIPLKVKGFVYDGEKKCWDAVSGVNITLGLPIIRTSVDHGTDFEHAGTGRGNEVSLVNAIDYAIRLAQNKE